MKSSRSMSKGAEGRRRSANLLSPSIRQREGTARSRGRTCLFTDRLAQGREPLLLGRKWENLFEF